MGIRDRSNGPTLGHATYKADRGPAPSPERQAVELTETARKAAFRRRLHKDPKVILELLDKK